MVITKPGKSISGKLVECVTAPLLIIGNLWQSTKGEMLCAENILEIIDITQKEASNIVLL